MNVFDEMGIYWAEMADQNQTEEQLQFLKTQLTPKGYVLDLACGTGRHMISLSHQGYNMVGLDVSANLLKIAKKRSKEIHLVRGDMRFLPFNSETFSATISMDTSFGYLQSEMEDRIALTEVFKVLTHQGIFVIDVFNRQQLTLKYRDKEKASKKREYSSFFLFQKRTVSPKGKWLCDLWTIQDKAGSHCTIFEHKVRLFESNKLEGLLDKARFAIKEIYGDYESEKFSAESPRLIFVAKTK